jgi:hypothetical protein
VNLEALNLYVLVAIGVFGAAVYVAMAFAGFSELISRMPKPPKRRKRSKAARRPRIR